MNFLDALDVARKITSAIDRLIVSNEKIAKSNEKYAEAMTGLTFIVATTTIANMAFSFATSIEDKSINLLELVAIVCVSIAFVMVFGMPWRKK